MKISIKTYNSKYSVEMRDEVNFMEFMEEVKALTKTIWAADQVNDYWE
jgi:hypothetical protein